MTSQTGNRCLVDAGWLARNLGRSDLLILDASPTKCYVDGHIPGAISVSFPLADSLSQGVDVSYGAGGDFYFDPEAPYPWQDAPLEVFQSLYRSWGVDPGKTVVVYDQGGTMFATRLFFSLYHHGFPPDRLALLDGGLFRWRTLGFELSSDIAPAPEPGSFRIRGVDWSVKATLEEFIDAARDPERNALINALAAASHTGQTQPYSKPGHIPHSISLPYSEFYDENRCFKAPAEIERMLTHLGIRREQTLYTHCGGGIAGSVPFFAIRLMLGYPSVKHSVESQIGYLHDPRDLPFWTYDAPYLLRDTDWLQWWGGRRTRTLGNIHVSIIDVRPAEAFRRGHIPFALNLPAEVFRDHVDDPQALAAILGRAGVDRRHEAVVVSGGGLDADSALAWLLLGWIGQRKVSILKDSLQTWTERGGTLTDAETVVAPRRLRFDLNVPPTDFRPALRKGVLARADQPGQGLYPDLYLAVGSDRPAETSGRPLVHLPAAVLLDGKGSPRSAATLSQLLAEAGLTRFAGIRIVADDPGEAALARFVLKLLGYPEVSVFLG